MKSETAVAQDFYSKRFRRNPDVVTRKIAGELFLVPIKGKIADMQRIFTLNPVAEFIWQMIDGYHDLGYLREQVAEHFKVERDVADTDIQEFIEELLQVDLISG